MTGTSPATVSSRVNQHPPADGVYRNPDEIREAYRDEGVARDYVANRFREPLGALLHDRQVDTVRRLLVAHQPRRVLELAPGPARLTTDLAPYIRGRAVALDASLQMLGEARRRLGSDGHEVRFVQGDAFQLPLGGGFDLAYTFRLIRHFGDADRLRLYRELHRVIRPGGRLVFDAVNHVVSAPLRAADPDSYKHYDALLDPRQVVEELAAAGFAVTGMDGVQHRYGVQSALQIYLAPRSRPLARVLMEAAENTGGEPLEWIVTCTRM